MWSHYVSFVHLLQNDTEQVCNIKSLLNHTGSRITLLLWLGNNLRCMHQGFLYTCKIHCFIISWCTLKSQLNLIAFFTSVMNGCLCWLCSRYLPLILLLYHHLYLSLSLSLSLSLEPVLHIFSLGRRRGKIVLGLG